MKKELISYNPGNGEAVGSVEITEVDRIDEIVKKAKDSQKIWKEYSIDERISLIDKGAKILGQHANEIGAILSQEMGKKLRSGIGEVMGCASGAIYTAKEVKEAIKPQIMKGHGVETTIQYNPLGVCAVITPWNYPVSMAHWLIIPALVAGNTVVFKPSEETPIVAQKYVDAFNQVLPEGVLQIIHGSDEQGKALVEADVNLIGFTGSKEVGKDIMKNASGQLKRLIMELGGKDPLIVMRDADIDRAAQFAVANALENAGQMCISTERIFVDEAIVDQFENKVLDYVKYFKVGSWDDDHSNVGPIINDKQRNIILNHIKDAVSKGAKVLAGGKNHPERFIVPTVLTNISGDMVIDKEETFGPVICIQKYSDIEDAIKKANDTDYGLGAVVFGNNNAQEVANQLEAGMVGVNQGVGGLGDTPWVGAKQSGFGYHGSPDGHRQFTQPRVVTQKQR